MRACPGVRDCTRYAIGRCLIRQFVADVRGCDPAEVVLDEPLAGQAVRVPPGGRVVWRQDERWLAMALTTDRPIALELAPVRPAGSLRRLRQAIATPDEARWLDTQPRAERPAALSRLRAMKVAWLRATGMASELDLSTVPVIDGPEYGAGWMRRPGGDWFVTVQCVGGGDQHLALAVRAVGERDAGGPAIKHWHASPATEARGSEVAALSRAD